MLTSATEHLRTQQRVTALAARAAGNAFRRRDVRGVLLAVIAAQRLVAADADVSVGAMLAEQGVSAPPGGSVNVAAFMGLTSFGNPLAKYLSQMETEDVLRRVVATLLQDTARMAAGVAVAARPRVGWVRMVNPPCCPRCAILAGKWFASSDGFERHPQCDCRHVPALEADWSDLTMSPDRLFREGKVRGLTQVESQAIGDGVDFAKVVNDRRHLWLDVAEHPSLRRIYRDNAGDHAATVSALRDAGYLF